MGVFIGIVLLVVLIGLVVLQGIIEWGGYDTDKILNFGKSKDVPADKDEAKNAAKPLVKPGVPGKKKLAAKRPSKKPANKKGAK